MIHYLKYDTNVLRSFYFSDPDINTVYIFFYMGTLSYFTTTTILLLLGLRSRYRDFLLAGWYAGRIPVGGEIFRPLKTAPGDHPASCTVGTGSLSRE